MKDKKGYYSMDNTQRRYVEPQEGHIHDFSSKDVVSTYNFINMAFNICIVAISLIVVLSFVIDTAVDVIDKCSDSFYLSVDGFGIVSSDEGDFFNIGASDTVRLSLSEKITTPFNSKIKYYYAWAFVDTNAWDIETIPVEDLQWYNDAIIPLPSFSGTSTAALFITTQFGPFKTHTPYYFTVNSLSSEDYIYAAVSEPNNLVTPDNNCFNISFVDELIITPSSTCTELEISIWKSDYSMRIYNQTFETSDLRSPIRIKAEEFINTVEPGEQLTVGFFAIYGNITSGNSMFYRGQEKSIDLYLNVVASEAYVECEFMDEEVYEFKDNQYYYPHNFIKHPGDTLTYVVSHDYGIHHLVINENGNERTVYSSEVTLRIPQDQPNGEYTITITPYVNLYGENYSIYNPPLESTTYVFKYELVDNEDQFTTIHANLWPFYNNEKGQNVAYGLVPEETIYTKRYSWFYLLGDYDGMSGIGIDNFYWSLDGIDYEYSDTGWINLSQFPSGTNNIYIKILRGNDLYNDGTSDITECEPLVFTVNIVD